MHFYLYVAVKLCFCIILCVNVHVHIHNMCYLEERQDLDSHESNLCKHTHNDNVTFTMQDY